MLAPQILGDIVNRHAIAQGLRADVVMCVVLQESGGDTFANRFEPFFYSNKIAHRLRTELAGFVPPKSPNLDTEKFNRSTSWGLMQVMGDTARWCAKTTTPFLTSLCDPERGVEAGCKVLAYYYGKEHGDYRNALARYNAGSVSETGLHYADEVLERIKNGEHRKYLQG